MVFVIGARCNDASAFLSGDSGRASDFFVESVVTVSLPLDRDNSAQNVKVRGEGSKREELILRQEPGQSLQVVLTLQDEAFKVPFMQNKFSS